MRRMAMLVAVAALSGVTAMFVPTSTPAQAAVHGACVGTGSASLGSPFTYPVSGANQGGGIVDLHVYTVMHSATFVFHLNSAGACVTSGGTVVPGISATGTMHGWCGLSFGNGTTSSGGLFSWVGIGGTLVLTGELSGVANGAPNALAGDSCITGADDFLVNGAGVESSGVAESTCTSVRVSVSAPLQGSTSVGTPEVHAHAHTGAHVHSHTTICR